jgi:hypothetical protein
MHYEEIECLSMAEAVQGRARKCANSSKKWQPKMQRADANVNTLHCTRTNGESTVIWKW